MDKWISKAAAGVLAAGLMAVAAQEAAAQKQRGDIFLLPQAGVNVSRLSGYDVLIGNTKQAATMESSSKAGLTAGLEAEYMVTGRLGALTFCPTGFLLRAKGAIRFLVANHEVRSAKKQKERKAHAAKTHLSFHRKGSPVGIKQRQKFPQGLAYKGSRRGT